MPPNHRRGPWSQQEDHYLLHLVNTQGAHNWVRISQIIGTRSPKQCRERFHQNLKPSLNHDPISPEEGALIERLVSEMGKRWAEIARRLNGRSDNAVKNWWNGGMNRRKRLDVRRSNSSSYRTDQYDRPDLVRFPPSIQASRYEGYDAYPDTLQRHHYQPTPRDDFRFSSIAQEARYIRRPVEPPLPSPSALSAVSRCESTDFPPSLVSDRTNSRTHSPRYPEPPSIELPPLGAVHPDSRRSSLHLLHVGSNQLVSDDQAQHAHYRHDELKRSPLALDNYRLQAPEPSSYHYMRQAPYGQRPLPDFRSLAAPGAVPELRPSPPSPTTRDSRMSLSAMLS